MAKSRARFLSELLGTTGLVKKSKSALAGADEVIDLSALPSIPNSKLTNSSITINSSATSLGGSVTLTTANVAENTNLYYTNARADARIAAASTSDLSEGTNLYYTDARADARVALIVDSAPGTLNTLNELAAALGDDASFSTTVTNSIAAKLPLAGGTLTGNLNLGDNVKAQFGASNDLQIYHDGSRSYISDQGTGGLRLLTNEFSVKSPDESENLFFSIQDGSTYLYENGDIKLTTTSTGIDVTGSVVADGTASSSAPKYTFSGDTNTGLGYVGTDSVGLIAGGSRKFYVNDTTAYFQNLSGGVNVSGSVTSTGLTVHSSTAPKITISNGGGTSPNPELEFFRQSGVTARITYEVANKDLVITNDFANGTTQFKHGSSEQMRLSSGNVNIPNGSLMVGSTTAPTARLHLKSASRGSFALRVTDSDTTNDILRSGSQADGDGFLQLRTVAGAGNVLFDASGVSYVNGGNFGIGESIPTEKLHIGGNIKMQSTTAIVTYQNAVNTWNLGLDAADASFKFKDGTDERLRIDSSGNLIVSGTAAGQATSVALHNGGYVHAVSSHQMAGIFDRRDSDGDIVIFRKDGSGTAVGSISTLSGRMAIGTGNTGLFFDSIRQVVSGHTMTGNTYSTTIDLGRSIIPFQNLHLSSTAYAPLVVANDIKATGSGGISFQTDEGTKRLEISDAGNVNIYNGSLMVGATTTPAYPLEVAATTSTSIAYQRTGVSAKKWGFHTDNDNTYWQNITDNVLALTIKNNGNVGIGTTSPTTAKLDVAGTALVENAKLKAIAESNTDSAVDVFVYDTRKDSDGGAWRKRTQNTSWYNETLNTSTRGARKEFPSVAVIVTESNKVTIYDGDDPDMPMWMVFDGGNRADMIYGLSDNSQKATKMLNGLLVSVGNDSGGQGGTFPISFIADNGYFLSDASNSPYKYQGNIEQRNDSLNISTGDSGNYGVVISRYVNDVAVTVLPNAPIDADTGLPVPTIAVATAGGVSVIKDDGSVINFTGATNYAFTNKIIFTSDHRLRFTMDSGNARFFRTFNLPSATVAVNQWDGSYDDGITGYLNYGSSGDIWMGGYVTAMTENDVANVTGLIRFEENVTTPRASLAAYISSTYNTGYVVGHNLLATLSDTDTTNAGAEIVTNGDFATDSGWTKGGGWTISGGKATHDSTTGNRYLTQGGILTAGKQYVLTFTISNYTSGTLRIYGSTTQPIDITEGNATYTIPFIATGDGDVNFQSSVSGAFIGSIDNVSCKLAEQDHSYYGNGLQVFGTVTKTAVATGAELVAYSGFSSSNALQTSYSSSYAVGTEFSASMWLKGGGDSQTPFAVESTNSSDSDSTILVHTHPNGFYFYTRGANDASWGATGAASIQSTNVGLSDWHMVTISQDAAGRKLYIDGKLNASDAVVKTIDGVEGTLVVNVGARPPNFFQNYTGKISLVRFSGTPVTPEQVAKMYNDEKHLFQENAKATLYGSSNAVTALAYDDDTNLLHAGTSAGRSVFQGLRRVDNTTDAVSTAISASNGFIVEE
jgi:hypothetical protein